MPQEPLTIDNFQNAIADSPHMGFGNMKLVDISAFPGAVKVQKAPQSLFIPANDGLTIITVGSNEIQMSGALTANANANSGGIAVYFTTTGVLPTGISANTIYYIKFGGGNSNYFQLSATFADALTTNIAITAGTGSGVTTMHVINPGTVKWISEPEGMDCGTNILMLDSNGRVWFQYIGTYMYLLANAAIDTGATVTDGTGGGMILWPFSNPKGGGVNYLFTFRGHNIDIVDVGTTAKLYAPTWSNAWKTMNSATNSANIHHALRGQDGIIYFTDDHYVGSIIEITPASPFTPGTAGTFTYNNQALDLPLVERANWLAELGVNLLIAGDVYNNIYPWDRVSDSYNIPLEVPEKSIKRLKNVGNLVYILAGVVGNIYTTQGTYVTHFKKIPDYVSNNAGSLQETIVTWGGLDTLNGTLIFGAGVLTSGNSGLYKLFPDGRLILLQQPSTGSGNVNAVKSNTEFFIMGYSGGGDNFPSGTTVRYASLNTVVQSGLYQVGNKTQKATYSELEVQLARPADASSHIRVRWRPDIVSSFTTLDSYTLDTTNTSFNSDIGLIDLENIQIQVEMDGAPELLKIILIP